MYFVRVLGECADYVNYITKIEQKNVPSIKQSGGVYLRIKKLPQLIGISTADIDSGQNINLAVGYEDINLFARGFYN